MLQFPQYEEIRLANPPIVEVICQVRFPVILRIANEQPADFQERVRSRFSNLEISQGVLVQISPISTTPAAASSSPHLYHFKTVDERYVITLAPDFFALSTKSYTHWADFVSNLIFAADAVREVYQIPHATRIGLRYINQFTLANTHSETIQQLWEMLRPELRAHWRTDAWEQPLETLTHLMLSGDAGERLVLRVGYNQTEEPACLLDLDYFAEGKMSLEDLITRCERYHEIIYNAFRWSVPEEKLAVFGALSTQGGE